MFTGLVEEVGLIKEIKNEPAGRRFIIAASTVLQDVTIGASIAVNGACQTVEAFSSQSFQIFSIPETLRATNFDQFNSGTRVNLERPLRVGDRLGGHFVQGHVENTAEIASVDQQPGYLDITISYRSPRVLLKGSICIDGISLTVQELQKDSFRVQIIPETIQKTNISDWKPGYRVNIETDYLLNAVEHMINFRKSK